jgi:hypothetical protein
MRWPCAALLLAVLAAPAGAREPVDANPGPDPDDPCAAEPCPVPPDDRLRVDVDFLYWFLERMRVPALLTAGTPQSGGVPGVPGTETLYGDGRLDSRHGRFVGVRFDVDGWFDAERTLGLDVSAFFLERDSSNVTVPWGADPVLARPYVDAADGRPKAFVVAGPSPGVGDLAGSFNAYSRIELFGQDASVLFGLARGEAWSVDALAGARFLQMRERLDLTGVSRVLPDEAVLLGATDHFHTFDKFFGAQLGLRGEARCGRWFAEGKLALAVGGDDQQVRTYGDRTYPAPGLRQTTDYGVYVLPGNRGSFERGEFDFVTEVRLDVGRDLTRHARVRVGYTLLTWLNPVRPGDQIGPVDLAQVAPGAPPFSGKPSVPFREDFFWAQGLNAGLEFRW